MKCNQVENMILLKDSGETTGHQDVILSAHLEECAPCRDFQRLITQARWAVGTLEEPDAKMVRNILRQARLNAPQKKTVKLFGLRPALAMAASVVIGLGIFFSVIGPGKVGLELVVTDTQLLESGDQFINVMYSGLSEDDLAFNFLMTFDEG